MKTPKEKIIALMMDGRERTIDDVANRLKMRRDVAKSELYKMGYNNELIAGQEKGVTFYRFPVSKSGAE